MTGMHSVLRKKCERSKKFRTLYKVKSEKPRYDDITVIPIYPTGSGLSPDLEDLMYLLLDYQNYGPEINIMEIKLSSWKQTASGNDVSAKDNAVSAKDNYLLHAVFDPLFKYNLKASLWECFSDGI